MTLRNVYDANGRLTQRTLYAGTVADSPTLATFTWEHDAIGNVKYQSESWDAAAGQPARQRQTHLTYDDANRLETERISVPGFADVTTTYTYDAANNRETKHITQGSGPLQQGTELGHWTYSYNNLNQLTRMAKRAQPGGSVLTAVDYLYDDNGNRTHRIPDNPDLPTTRYVWDSHNTFIQTYQTGDNPETYTYTYDHRTRRIAIQDQTTATTQVAGPNGRITRVLFSGGVSVAEMDLDPSGNLSSGNNTEQPFPTIVQYVRGPYMGGGVGGLLYTVRNPVYPGLGFAWWPNSFPYYPAIPQSLTYRYNLSNGRGDIVAQSDSAGALTWTASYEAYGKRTKETGQNKDKQRANSKDEDPTGLLNEGFRYRDLETGVWLSRDPAGFVDGPNLYAYVMQNPWTSFDPDGLEAVPVPGGGYMFKSNEDPANYIGKQVQHSKPGYNGQCATGAQYTCGTVKKNGKVYDAPSTNSSAGGGPWKKGQSLRDHTPPKGTMIAWGFDKDGRYPSTPAGNHTAMYEGPVDNKGNFTAISQNRRTVAGAGPSPFSRDDENVNRNDWHVVVADKPHDPRPSQSSLVQMPDDPNYPNLDRPQGGGESPTASAKPKKSFGQKVKDFIGGILKKKEKK